MARITEVYSSKALFQIFSNDINGTSCMKHSVELLSALTQLIS